MAFPEVDTWGIFGMRVIFPSQKYVQQSSRFWTAYASF